MGDVGDYWNEHKQYLKEQRRKRAPDYEPSNLPSMPINYTPAAKLTKKFANLGFEVKSDYHWQTRILGALLDYWPTSGKWRYEGKTHVGPADQLVGFIKNRTAPKATP